MLRERIPESETAVFSWTVDGLRDVGLLADLGVRAIFQEVPEGREAEVLDLTSGVDAYLLTGCPDMDGAEMMAEIDRSLAGFRGVVFDIEPYGCASWEDEGQREALLDAFATQVEDAYAHARELGVEMYVCIPFWFDDLGFTDQLERVIEASDGTCVMNYSVGNEEATIACELGLARRHQKRMWTIFELSPADGEGVTEYNTYHDRGLRAVTESYREHFAGSGVGLAYHELESLVLLAREEGRLT